MTLPSTIETRKIYKYFTANIAYCIQKARVQLPLVSTFYNKSLYAYCTRGIWKVLSTVFYLSNRFTKPIMFGIILKSYLSSMLWHKFHEDIFMQTWIVLLWIHELFVYWKTQNFSGKYNILPFEKFAEH